METVGQSKITVYKIISKNVENPLDRPCGISEPTRTEAVGVATNGDHLILKGDVLLYSSASGNSRQNLYEKCWMKTLIEIMPNYSV